MSIAGSLAALALAATVSAGERTPAVMWVIFPKEVAPRTSGSTYVDAARTVLGRDSRVSLISAERAGIDLVRLPACPPAERYRCWLSAVRRDAPDEAPRRRRPASAPRYLFVVAVQPAENGLDALSLIFLDTDLARAKIAEIPEDTPDRAELIESEIFNLTVRAPPVPVDSMSTPAIERWFRERLAGPIRAQLAKNGDAEPLGRISVWAPAKDWPLALDGETIAATSTTALLIEDVLPGVRRLTIVPPGGFPIARDVRVGAARTATVGFGLEPGAAAPANDGTLRYGLVFGGIAASSVGGVLLASALSRVANVREACVVRSGAAGECENLGTITLSHDAANVPSLDPGAVNPRGVAMAPLAVGLLGGGAILAGGAFLLRDFEEDWWWPVVAGVGFCAASYGFGVLVDPR